MAQSKTDKERRAKAHEPRPVDKTETAVQPEPVAPADELRESEGWDGEDEAPDALQGPPPEASFVPATSAADDEPRVPAFGQEEDAEEEYPAIDPEDEPLAKEYVILAGPASFGPVIIDGKKVTVFKGKLYLVRDPAERADILGTGRFRAAIRKDVAGSTAPSAGRGGAITRDLLPPGALKKRP